MIKKYNKTTDEQRKELIRLIYEESYTIKEAGVQVGIPYANAKAVN
jgi:allophanate hydrolase subunit 1